MFEVGGVVSLSDGENFIIAGTATLNNVCYYYLIGEQNLTNVRFCKEIVQDDRVFMQEFTNKKLLEKLYPLFIKSTKDYFAANPNN